MIAIDVGLLRRTVGMHGPYLKAYIEHHVQQMLLHFVHVTYLHLLLRFNVALGCYGEMFSDTWTKSCFVHMLTHGCESRFFSVENCSYKAKQNREWDCLVIPQRVCNETGTIQIKIFNPAVM